MDEGTLKNPINSPQKKPNVISDKPENLSEKRVPFFKHPEDKYWDLAQNLENDKSISLEDKVHLADEAIRNINIEMEDVKKKYEAEELAYAKARATLGLSPDEDKAATVSIRAHGNKEEQLYSRRSRLIRLKKQFEEAQISSDIKSSKQENGVEQVSDVGAFRMSESIKKLTGALHQRERDSLTPIVDRTDISRITGAAEKFEDLSHKKEINSDELQTAISSLLGSLRNFGSTESGGAMQESTESLGRINFAFDEISTDIKTMSRKIKEDPKLEGVSKSLTQLDKDVDSIKEGLARKISALNRYLGK